VFDVRVLGAVEVRSGAGALVDVGGPRPRGFLAQLVLAEGNAVTVSDLLSGLGTAPDSDAARSGVYAVVSRLRRALGPDHRLDTAGGGYRWSLERDEVDLLRFRDLARRAAADPEPWRAAVHLDGAVAEIRGRPLSGLEALPLHAQHEPALAAEVLATRLARARALLGCGRADEVVAPLAELAEEHPYDERIRDAHLRALVETGQVPAALRAFEQWRRLLADELGTTPSPRLEQLHDELLRRQRRPAGAPRTERRRQLRASDGPTTFDREAVLATIEDDLRSSSTAELTGAAGVGLTTIGRSLLARLGARFDRAALVSASVERTPGWLPVTAARTLGLHPHPADDVLDAIAFAFRERPVLLVLDDVTPASRLAVWPLVDTVLTANRDSRVILLHREPAHGYAIPPLPSDDGDSPAVALLLAATRQHAGLGHRPLHPRTAVAIAGLCGGLPLAITLAARLLAVVEPDELLELLRARTGQTPLEALAAVSSDTLGPPARGLVSMLATVTAGLPEDEATELAVLAGADRPSVPRMLETALARGLLTVTEDHARHAVPAGLRPHLAPDDGDAHGVRIAIASRALALVERETAAGTPAEQLWCRQVAARYPDLHRAVLEAIASGEVGLAARMVRGLGRWWELEGPVDDAISVSDALLAELGGGDPEVAPWRAEIHEVRGHVRAARHRPNDATIDLRAALEGDPDAPPLVAARRQRLLAAVTGDPHERARLLERAAAQLSGDDHAVRRERAATSLQLAQLALAREDLAGAGALARTAHTDLLGMDAEELRREIAMVERQVELADSRNEREAQLEVELDELTSTRARQSGHGLVAIDVASARLELLLRRDAAAAARLHVARREAEHLGDRELTARATALAAHAERLRHEAERAGALARRVRTLEPRDPETAALALATLAWADWRRSEPDLAAEHAHAAGQLWPPPLRLRPFTWTSGLVVVALGDRADLTCWLPEPVLEALRGYAREPDAETRAQVVRRCREERLL
jgi:DNA-binding SARP family transcriptional activator